MSFAKKHQAMLRATNPIGQVSGEIKRHTGVVGIFVGDAAVIRLVGTASRTGR
ncbi:transposase [Paracoccus tibetensis]|uniref:transposase n=1 Tax=Paracoccus tibetensis TaxID=336292 RepID=UPI0015871537|nr:transposase [Paracoccus tibetensis]